MLKEKTIDVIVPCFNEEENLDIFFERMVSTLKKINLKYRIIFVDDGSKDNTWEKIINLKKKRSKYTWNKTF